MRIRVHHTHGEIGCGISFRPEYDNGPTYFEVKIKEVL